MILKCRNFVYTGQTGEIYIINGTIDNKNIRRNRIGQNNDVVKLHWLDQWTKLL